ncbi:MAG: GNAT family N-acetyltransferase, partial [Sulfurimonas sp.]|nr:GNAT family N-acetyltransferase [Sulfurimonas sp.]
HLAYIESLSLQSGKKYFLAKMKNEYMGVVNLTNIVENQAAELGIYAKPNTLGNGTVLMHKIIRFAFDEMKIKKLFANAYINNENAINLYKKFHFNIYGKSKDKNGDLVQMELYDENK